MLRIGSLRGVVLVVEVLLESLKTDDRLKLLMKEELDGLDW